MSNGTPSTPTLNADAVKFVQQLYTNQTLLTAYATQVSTAQQQIAAIAKQDNLSPDAIQTIVNQKIDNWLVSQGYQCTVSDVLVAENAVAAYQLAFWSAAYSTKLSPVGGGTTTAGSVFLVTGNSQSTSAQMVSYGQDFYIAPTFSQLTLSIPSDAVALQSPPLGALNITFTMMGSNTSGASKRSFYGTIELNGTTQNITGLETDIDANTQKQLPPQQSENLKLVTAINTYVGLIAQVAFLSLNIVGLYKTYLEIQKLKQQGNNEEAAKEQENADQQEEGGENANEELGNANEEVQNMDQDDVNAVNQELGGGGEGGGGDVQIPDVNAPNEEQQDMLDEQVQEDENNEDGGEDEDGEDDGDGDGEGDGAVNEDEALDAIEDAADAL
jgi:hypothetical protein